jgi:ATP-dependent DNA helicase PIF1
MIIMTKKKPPSLILLLVLLALYYESGVSLVLQRPHRHDTRLHLSSFELFDGDEHIKHEEKEEKQGYGDLSRLSFKQSDALEQLLSALPSSENEEAPDLADLSRLTQSQAQSLQYFVSSFPRPSADDLEPIIISGLEEETDYIEEEKSYEEEASNNSKEKGSDDSTLSPKQAEALRLIKEGDNVFITGVAGTGKSLVLQRALNHFRDVYSWETNCKKYVAVAPTGPTALALGGQTIHSFAGIGIPKTQENFSKTRKNKEIAKRWTELDVLVLDECSMVSGEFLDRLSREVSMIRRDERPFGGIQLIICGDFLQLPPIPPRNADVQDMRAAMEEKGQEPDDLFLNRGFAFQSRTWRDANFRVLELDVVFRQKNQEYVNILMDIRRGRVTPEVIQFLKKCDRPLPQNEFGIRPTILHSRNKDVSRENLQELQKLDGKSYVYDAMDSVDPDKGSGPWVRKQLEQNGFFKSCIAEKDLQLRIGAQVLLVKGIHGSKLVNGSRGKVIGFRKAKGQQLNGMFEFPVVQFLNGISKVMTPQKFDTRLVGLGTCTRTAVPLKLAWAITTHKSQGLTLDYVVADVGGVFGEAQAYVALSRATSETGLELRNFSSGRVRANPVALDFYSTPNKNYAAWDGSTTTNPKYNRPFQSGEKKNGEKVPSALPPHPAFPSAGIPTTSPGESSDVLENYTVPELKSMLKARGLKVSGKKGELIQRLCTPVYE